MRVRSDRRYNSAGDSHKAPTIFLPFSFAFLSITPTCFQLSRRQRAIIAASLEVLDDGLRELLGAGRAPDVLGVVLGVLEGLLYGLLQPLTFLL